MEINNNPALSLIPTILGDKNAVQPQTAEKTAVEKTTDNSDGSSRQLTRVVSETEKQAAQRQLQEEKSGQEKQNLFREESTASQNRAINAYLQTEQAEQDNYLSTVLGIDVYT